MPNIFNQATKSNQNNSDKTKLMHLGQIEVEELFKKIDTSENGLNETEVNKRLKIYGENEVAHTKPIQWWIQLINAFSNPFILILILLGLASFFTDIYLQEADQQEWTKIIILTLMVFVSGFLRFWQEYKSQKASEKLRALVQNKTSVERIDKNGNSIKKEVPVSQIVPGDIVYLSAGDMIPADMRIIFSDDCFVNQSTLTGESEPVEKFSQLKSNVKSALELETLCFMGTNVISGTAKGVVLATGDRTYFSTLAKVITSQREMSSFDKGVNQVSWLLIRFMLVMVPIVFLINILTKGDWHQAFFFSLAIAVGLTPEMLPLVVTANLAKGANKMAEQRVIVKKLEAIQNFGAMDVLCTDKTGTITENRVVLIRHIDIKGEESERVMDYAYLNSHFQTGLKNLMDQAVVEYKESKESSMDEVLKYHKVDEIPFDFDRRRMSVAVQKDEEEHLLICKGAVEEILKICTHVDDGKKIKPLSSIEEDLANVLKHNLNIAGLRVLAIAYKKTGKKSYYDYKVVDEKDMILVGYVGFLDPPKASAKESIKLLEQHGVNIKIITGDNEIVTKSICKQVNLSVNKILLGEDIKKMTEEELQKEVEITTVFAKIDPLQKAKIIKALKLNGHVVGYMGDGVNDAAALREADVGVSVDGAVDIAKESADIILLDNDLLVLEHGVIQGRTVFGNIMKYLKMTSSSNFGNVFSILAGSFFLPFLPMLPIHLLIQNLLYDFSQLSIPWDKMDESFIKKPKKWASNNLTKFMIYLGPISSIFDILTFLVLWYIFGASTNDMQSLFQSGWFIEGLLSQTLIVHMIRTEKIPFFESSATKPVLLLTISIILIGLFIPFSPIGEGIGLVPLPISYFPYLIAIILGYCISVQIVKNIYIKKFGSWL